MSYEQDPKPEMNQENTHATDERDSEKEESFSFLQETIKPKPMSREKILIQLARVAIYGLIFGTFACCGFFALKPWAEDTFQKDAETVTIPEDDEQEQQEEIPEEKVEEPVLVLDAERYQEMMDSLYDIAVGAEKSVVSVRAVGDGDWLTDSESKKSVTGLYAADNGRDLLILADNSICRDASAWMVTFADHSEYKASLVKQDKVRGLAVFAVERNGITSATWGGIRVAALGNSNLAAQGDMVIALGNLSGYEGGLGYGVISSKEHTVSFADGRCGLIVTDIAASSDGTGILFNQSGEVLGLIKANTWEAIESNTANALAVSDLKSVMEILLNGESVPYIGILGTFVTDEISEQQNIPAGIYVTQVQADSPAMAAGIQNGDILQEIAGSDIVGIASYERTVLDCKPGDNIKIKGQRRGANGYVDIDFTVTVRSQE